MKYKEKQKAIEFRRQGMSMLAIASILGVSKSSVSVWVRDVYISDSFKNALLQKNKSQDVVERRRSTRIKNEESKRNVVINRAEKDFEKLSKPDLKIIGTMLYFAEGGKTQRGLVRFSNSNPSMVKIMMKFFRDICNVTEGKFKGHIHTHSEKQVKEAEQYWSEVTKIPVKQFFKTYIKYGSSSQKLKNNLPYGTFDIYVCDINLFLNIKGWTNKITKLVLDTDFS